MRIELHQSTSLEAHIYDNQNRLHSIIPQYDIIGLPDLTAIHLEALQQYLSNCYTRLSQTSDGSYLLRLHPKLKGGGDWDFLVGALMVAGGTALTVFTGGLASVPGAALAGGGIKGCIHAINSDENFSDGFFDSVFVGGVTGTLTGGIGVLGPAAGSFANAVTGFTNAATYANVGVNVVGSVAATATEAVMEGKEVKVSDLLTSAVVGGIASGVQCMQTDTITEAAKKGKAATEAFNSAASNLKQKTVAKVSKNAAAKLSKTIADKTFKECLDEVGSTAVSAMRANGTTALEMSKAPAAAMAAGVVVGGTVGAIDGGSSGAARGAGKGAAQGLVVGLAVQTQGSLSDNLLGVIVPGSTKLIHGQIKTARLEQKNRNLENKLDEKEVEIAGTQASLRQAQELRTANVAELQDARERLSKQEDLNKELEAKLEKATAANSRPVEETKEFENPVSPPSDVSHIIRRRR
jgi:hypothetical protein